MYNYCISSDIIVYAINPLKDQAYEYIVFLMTKWINLD